MLDPAEAMMMKKSHRTLKKLYRVVAVSFILIVACYLALGFREVYRVRTKEEMPNPHKEIDRMIKRNPEYEVPLREFARRFDETKSFRQYWYVEDDFKDFKKAHGHKLR